ncbi:MAG TPA: nodulation protein NfeD, partial [Spirochaetota bacterium]|nr:nodulation protein NfeD [Spirochaetota bacterium]
MKRLLIIVSALALLSGTLSAKERYAVLTLEGSVNPIMSQYLVEAMKIAQKDGVRFIVIKLDTPGGMVDSMREINKAIMASEAPVVVYTYPR